MNKGAIIFLVTVVLTTLLSVGYANASRETSWITTIEELIVEENWEPDREYIPLMRKAFFLIEDGLSMYRLSLIFS